MIFFDAQDSLLPLSSLEDVLVDNYGFGEMHCSLLAHSISDVFVLENGSSKYIFKVYQDTHRKLEEIEAEVELLNILYLRGAQVSYPIPDKTGREIQNFTIDKEFCYGVLFSYAKGKVYFNMNHEQLATLGREMAIMHNITSNVELKHNRKELNLNSLLLKPIKRIEPAFKGLEDEYLYLQQTANYIATRLQELDLSSFSYGYCHYDLLPVNFHFQDNKKITFFDFDHLGKGYLINDLVSFYTHYFLQMMFNRITHEEVNLAFNIFITNYRKTRSLATIELEAIPYFGFAFWIFYIDFDYNHFDNRSSTKYLKDQVGWIKKWVDWYIEPITNSH